MDITCTCINKILQVELDYISLWFWCKGYNMDYGSNLKLPTNNVWSLRISGSIILPSKPLIFWAHLGQCTKNYTNSACLPANGQWGEVSYNPRSRWKGNHILDGWDFPFKEFNLGAWPIHSETKPTLPITQKSPQMVQIQDLRILCIGLDQLLWPRCFLYKNSSDEQMNTNLIW